eukprot:COSAG06_NODE_19370_length_841_cov_2.831536_1_plen_181_part_00
MAISVGWSAARPGSDGVAAQVTCTATCGGGTDSRTAGWRYCSRAAGSRYSSPQRATGDGRRARGGEVFRCRAVGLEPRVMEHPRPSKLASGAQLEDEAAMVLWCAWPRVVVGGAQCWSNRNGGGLGGSDHPTRQHQCSGALSPSLSLVRSVLLRLAVLVAISGRDSRSGSAPRPADGCSC